jgi:hypothetical protein
MADVRSLTVKWIGDVTSLVRSTKAAESAVKQTGKGIETAGSKMGGTFGKLGQVLGTFNLPFSGSAKKMQGELSNLEQAGVTSGSGIGGAMTAGMGVAGAAAIEFGREAIQAAEDFNKAHERLAVVVGNVGESMTTEGGKIQGADSRLEKLGFSSTETEGALAKLVPVTHDVGKASTLLGVATDIARARNMSLDEATGLLVAVEGGRLKGLNKLGIATKDASGHTITAAEAVVKLNQAFGGAASTYADSYAGKLAVMKAETTDLKVALGNQLIPILSNFAGGATIALNGLDTASKHMHVNFSRVASDVLSLGLDEFRRKIEADSKAQNTAADVTKKLAAAQQAYADDLAAGDTTSRKAYDDRKALNTEQAKAKAITDGLTAAATTATGAQQQQTAAEKAATKESQAHAKALQTETDAILGTRDANIALDNATLGVSDSLDTYNAKALIAVQAGGKNAQANRDWEKASNDVKGSIDGVASSAKAAADQQDDLRGKAHSVAHETDAERGALEKLRGTIAPGNPFRSYLDQLIAQLDRAAAPRTETFHAQIIASGPAGAIVFHPSTQSVNTPGSVRLFQHGGVVPGPVGAPVPAIVHGGEEVLTPEQRRGGGNNYSITVNVAPGADPAATGKAVVDAIRAYERRNGSSWRGAA